ncbi:hypothetical protein BH24ACT22_BH24ACT22_18430 [soil metagenome]
MLKQLWIKVLLGLFIWSGLIMLLVLFNVI